MTCRHEIQLALRAHAEARHIEEIRGILPIILGPLGACAVPDSEHAAITKFLQTLELQNMIPRGFAAQCLCHIVSPIVNAPNLASIASPWPLLSQASNMLGMQWIHDGRMRKYSEDISQRLLLPTSDIPINTVLINYAS